MRGCVILGLGYVPNYFCCTSKVDFGASLLTIRLFFGIGSINTADGSALVRMGGTTIVCGVKAEIAEPDLEKPNEGFLGEFTRI